MQSSWNTTVPWCDQQEQQVTDRSFWLLSEVTSAGGQEVMVSPLGAGHLYMLSEYTISWSILRIFLLLNS